jgi:hypothetical protein
VSRLVRVARFVVDLFRVVPVSVLYARTERNELAEHFDHVELAVMLADLVNDIDSKPFPVIVPPSLEEMANCREAAESHLHRRAR